MHISIFVDRKTEKSFVLDLHVYMHIVNELFFRARKRWKIMRTKNVDFDAYFARAEGTLPARAALLRARAGLPG